MLSVRTPKSQRVKRALEKRAPKLVENAKKTLILQGTKSSDVLNKVLAQLYHLKRESAIRFTKKNDSIHPFESGGEASLEFFSHKTDCSLFVQPFNAEPQRGPLIASYITPVELFYKRNHGPIPIVNDITRYRVSIGGLSPKQIELSMADIRALPKYNITATLQCAGNRRTAMSNRRKVKGVGWDVCALGNAIWGGAKLCDVLELVGIPKNTNVTASRGKHVEFVSVDRCPEEKGGPYKASVPLRRATDPAADILLAYEMNGEILNRDHGYPLRVIVPGVIAARSVKWLDHISVIEEESQGFFMAKDYKTFPPTVDWDNIVWSSRKPQMDYPVQSAICSLEDVSFTRQKRIAIAGYALSGGGQGIERVDLSIDGGKTWFEASRHQKSGVHYVPDDVTSDRWAWVLFKAVVDVPDHAEIIVKSVDSAANVQPEDVSTIWNLRGILNTSWHRVQVFNASMLPHAHL